MQIVFTGRAVDPSGVFHHRNALFTACEEIGWTVRGQVDSATSVLVAPADFTDTKKVRDAQRMGVQVRDYQWFFSQLAAERRARIDRYRAQNLATQINSVVEVRGHDGANFSMENVRFGLEPERVRSSFDRGVNPVWFDLEAIRRDLYSAGPLEEALSGIIRYAEELGMTVEGRLTGPPDTAPIRFRAYSGPRPMTDRADLFDMYDLAPGRMQTELAGRIASRNDAARVPAPQPYVRKVIRRGIS